MSAADSLSLSREELERIVGNAVKHAIAEYEHARGLPLSGVEPEASPVAPAATANPVHTMPVAQAERLQHEMGLDDLGFAAEPGVPEHLDPQRALRPDELQQLQHDMGMDDLALPNSEADQSREGAAWIAQQLAPQEIDEQDLAELAEHRAAEPLRHVADAVRAGVSHLADLVHPHKHDFDPEKD